VRYGVPWQYSGKEVVVRERNGKIEILYEGKVIATTGITANIFRRNFGQALPWMFIVWSSWCLGYFTRSFLAIRVK